MGGGMKYTLQLSITRPPLSLNVPMNHYAKARIVRELKDEAHTRCLALKIPKGCKQATYTLTYHPSDLRSRDTDNPTPTLKALIDGATRYGVTADDSSEYVTSSCVIGKVRKPSEVTLTIEVVQ
jgi:hypothetical protein